MRGADNNAITKAVQSPIDIILNVVVVFFPLSLDSIFILRHDWMLILKLNTLVKGNLYFSSSLMATIKLLLSLYRDVNVSVRICLVLK
jgi:hypothetical protein